VNAEYEALYQVHAHLEYMIDRARGSTTDDKLSPETRLVMVAVALSDIDRQYAAVDAALMRLRAALRAAQSA
jgi:hypothetical protein